MIRPTRMLWISVPFFTHETFHWVMWVQRPRWHIWNLNGGGHCELESGEER